MPGNFFDTNVLLYTASSEPAKADRAEELINGGGTISVQVLNEVTNVARRKMNLSWADTRTFLATFRALLDVRSLTVEIHESALAVAERYGLSIYDSLIVAAALDAESDLLWSEDMHDGLVIENRLRISNPFRTR
jgi:predicted nucleic acid-binding protein